VWSWFLSPWPQPGRLRSESVSAGGDVGPPVGGDGAAADEDEAAGGAVVGGGVDTGADPGPDGGGAVGAGLGDGCRGGWGCGRTTGARSDAPLALPVERESDAGAAVRRDAFLGRAGAGLTVTRTGGSGANASPPTFMDGASGRRSAGSPGSKAARQR
jgi:hypothetical protein